MAERYGVLPSEIAKLSAEEFAFNRLVYFTGAEEAAKKGAKQKRPPAPQLGKRRKF